MPNPRWPAVVALIGMLAAGCAGGQDDGRAAEPATAPSPGKPPAGRVVKLGSPAEGLVVDPETHTVAAGLRDPNVLALLDGKSGKVRHRVELPGNLRHLQLQDSGGPVLAPLENADRLVRVDMEDGKIIASVPTGKHPHDATAAETGGIFVADEFGGSVSVVREDRVAHRFGELAQPGGIAAAGDLVGLIDVKNNTLTVFDAVRLGRKEPVAAGDGPTHIVADKRDRMIVADTRGEAVLVFEPSPEVQQVSRIALPGNPYGLAYDDRKDRLWVTLTGRNELVGLDLGAGEPRETTRLPTVRQPNSVAVDPETGRVYVASRADGILQIIEPD